MTKAQSAYNFAYFTAPRLPSGAPRTLREDSGMVKIRLFRAGAKKRPKYRIVAVDSRTKRSGRVLEFLGTYDPLAPGTKLSLKRQAFDAWVGKGARVSDSVASLIRKRRREREAAEEPQPAAS